MARRKTVSDGLPEGLFARMRNGKAYYYTIEDGTHVGLGTDPAMAMAKLSSARTRKMSTKHPPHRLLTWGEILDTSLDVEGFCGIYFLIKNLKIVYVGQSLNVIRRSGQHPDKDFDRFSWVLCKRSELDDLERAYIKAFDPPLNIRNY